MSEAAPDSASEPLLAVRNLSKEFAVSQGLFARGRGVVHAVTDVNLDLFPGETLGLVGESGSGKSTLGRAILRLIEPTRGSVRFQGRELVGMPRGELRALRRHMQIVFQDPYGSLNPRMTVGDAVGEAFAIHRLVSSQRERNERVAALLERVGLRPEAMNRYPHEFSGGQRQRIGIARALAVSPKLIVCDEPVSALDVSVQAQIVNLLKDLSEELGIGYLFIAHDLHVVEFMSQRVAVMYLGRIVEQCPAAELVRGARHPYTRALLSAVPSLEDVLPNGSRSPPGKRLKLAGEVPSPLRPPSGCAFHPRCPDAQKGLCDVTRPELKTIARGHQAACHLVPSEGLGRPEQSQE